jgi:peptide/nickel transport system substrate-binding protein
MDRSGPRAGAPPGGEASRAGEAVVVSVPAFRRRVGRYFAGLLDDLGFRASVRVLGNHVYWDRIQSGRSRAQMGFVGWWADFASPSTFIAPSFGCAPAVGRQVLNASRLCDPALTRLVGRALATPVADAAGPWAAADRRVTDLAAAVPMTNRRAVVLVSERTGNVQNHGQWFTLFDQLWVR